MRNVALPEYFDLPSELDCFSPIPPVPLPVLPELLFPETSASRGCRGEATAGVPVPEAAVHEDDRTALRQDDVRATGQVAAVEGEAQSGSMQSGSDKQLGLRVLPPDG